MKGSGIHITGIQKFNVNIKRAQTAGYTASMKALVESAIIIQNDMDKKSPVVPVRHRNLQSSFFITTREVSPVKGKPKEDPGGHSATVQAVKADISAKAIPMLGMGFTANYATFVHEMQGDINWKRQGSGAKFFEIALNRNEGLVKQILATNMKKF